MKLVIQVPAVSRVRHVMISCRRGVTFAAAHLSLLLYNFLDTAPHRVVCTISGLFLQATPDFDCVVRQGEARGHIIVCRSMSIADTCGLADELARVEAEGVSAQRSTRELIDYALTHHCCLARSGSTAHRLFGYRHPVATV
jgi:hypothetical protein